MKISADTYKMLARRLWHGVIAFASTGLLAQAGIATQKATYGQQVVAAVLLAEARGEGLVGMKAVAEVIRRRADARGVSMLAVLKAGAFSSLNGTTRDRLVRRFHRDPLWSAALAIARRAYNNPATLENLTRGANHFLHMRVQPEWAVGQQPVAMIGNHAFYRLD